MMEGRPFTRSQIRALFEQPKPKVDYSVLILYAAWMALGTVLLFVAGTDWMTFDIMVLMAGSMQ